MSYSQNAEDVRLWRVFGHRSDGFYVDVGAGDPVFHSVTKLFYDAGWSGVNIEPGPLYEKLVEARPRDVNLDLAVSATQGEADLWVSAPESGLSSLIPPPRELVPEGFTFERRTVRCARLDDVIGEHAAGRLIDFLKIDVEGAEGDVLSSFDLGKIRPSVVLVEAISPLENLPNHEEWESIFLENSYVFAAFDGINRFYVPAEHDALIQTLAYPMSILDQYEPIDVITQTLRANRAESLASELRSQLAEEAAARAAAQQDLDEVRFAYASALRSQARHMETRQILDEMLASRSWRVTSPLRDLSRLGKMMRRGPSR